MVRAASSRVFVVFPSHARRANSKNSQKFQLLVVHRFSAPFTALVGGTEVKVDAMAADAEVSATGGAGFATSRLGRGIPFPTALVAVACHGERMTAWAKKKREAGLSAGL